MAGRMAKPAKRSLVPAPDGDLPLLLLPARAAAVLAEWKREREPRRENAYKCDVCGLNTVTVDVHTGTTPMFLGCRRGECQGRAVSQMYPAGRRPDDVPDPAWEWYRPSADEVGHMVGAMRDYVLAGGLELRPVQRVLRGL